MVMMGNIKPTPARSLPVRPAKVYKEACERIKLQTGILTFLPRIVIWVQILRWKMSKCFQGFAKDMA